MNISAHFEWDVRVTPIDIFTSIFSHYIPTPLEHTVIRRSPVNAT